MKGQEERLMDPQRTIKAQVKGLAASFVSKVAEDMI